MQTRAMHIIFANDVLLVIEIPLDKRREESSKNSVIKLLILLKINVQDSV